MSRRRSTVAHSDLPERDDPNRHPGFLPYRRLREELLGLPAEHWIARCDSLAAARGLRSAAGAPIRFMPGKGATGALDYEAAILHKGTIACRTASSGGRHDLHNALIWLTFPRIKATLNRLHLCADAFPAAGRGPLRDRLTLIDESGLLWLSNSPVLDAQLFDKDWSGLLVRNRQKVRQQVWPIVFGHGLLEKLSTPYKSMTAHCLVCSGPWAAAVPAGDPEALVDGDRMEDIDADVAARLAASCAGGVPPRLAPLPVQGLPGWDPANSDRSYYDDTRVFRSPRLQRA